MCCNNSYVFCGMEGGEVKVYSMIDGQWVRDLESGEEGLGVGEICGGESIVAAWLGAIVVTVWSSKEEMGRLHSLNVRSLDGMKFGFVGDIKVTGNKVVLLLMDHTPLLIRQLVVLQEGEHNWENKILETFPTQGWGRLAVDKGWWAVAVREESRSDIVKVNLWEEELLKRDIELPGVSAGDVQDVVLESPFLVVGGTSWSGDRLTSWIKVFNIKLAADNLMEDLNSAASLVKTLQFPGFYAHKLLCTKLVLGCLMVNADGRSLVLFEKTALLDTSTPPEQTPGNRVHLGTIDYNVNTDVNTTGLVFIQQSESESESSPGRDGQEQNYLCKKDFWMSRNIDG